MSEERESDRLRARLKTYGEGMPLVILLLLGGSLVGGLLDGSLRLFPYLVGVAVLLLAGGMWEKRSLQRKLIEAEIAEYQQDKAKKEQPPRRLEDHEFFKSMERK